MRHSLLIIILINSPWLPQISNLRCRKCIKENCQPIDPSECESKELGRKRNICKCCEYCAKGVNETCGGSWNGQGFCASYLECMVESSEQLVKRRRNSFKVGTCKHKERIDPPKVR